MKNQIVKLAKKLISIKSTSDNLKELDKVLQTALYPLKNFKVELFKKKGIKSALIYNSKKRPNKFKILLNGHLDVIPGKEFQYFPIVKNNKLYGTGSMDMKSAVACQILVFKELASEINYPLGLQLVTDEEIGGFNGTKYQIDEGVKSDFVLVGESTQLDIENESKGILWLKISCKGKSAHGAYPWKGENAVWKMNKFLNILNKEFPEQKSTKWVTTVNLSSIRSNNLTFNKIPDHSEIWLDVRYLANESKTISSRIKKILPGDFNLEIVIKEPAQFTKKNNKYLNLLKLTAEKKLNKKISILSANGSSDLRHFSRINCPGVEFGPIGKGMGSDNEWVDIKSLENYYKILKDFLLSVQSN